jgi:arylsulfatase A-like enzyme
MNRNLTISIWLFVVLAAGFTFLPGAGAKSFKKPNILLILLDNTGWGDFGAYGGGELRGAPSPNIDRMAEEGLLLQNFNTEPQCTPSRSALMTGRFAIRSGNQSVPVGLPYYGLVPWEVTIAELLSETGYATGAFGKWHLGKTPGRFPTDQGFDEWWGIPNSTDESFWNSPEQIEDMTIVPDLKGSVPDSQVAWVMKSSKGEKPEKLKKYDLAQRRTIDAEITQLAINFMKSSHEAKKPFFAYVPYTAMHYPTYPHPDFAGKSGNGMYADMLVQTDHYVGELLNAIREMKIDKNTLVIFAADNGPETPDLGDGHMNGWAGPWAGTYFTALEGGLRAPCIVRWTGKIPAGGKSNEIVHIVDLFSTCVKAAGARVPTDRPIDGVDMVDFFTGKRDKSDREGFPIFVGNDLYAVKWRTWKAHFIWQDSKFSPKITYSTVPKVVNLITDPREKRQVAEPYNNWLQYPFMNLLGRFQHSVKQFPNVPLGAPDTYAPPR